MLKKFMVPVEVSATVMVEVEAESAVDAKTIVKSDTIVGLKIDTLEMDRVTVRDVGGTELNIDSLDIQINVNRIDYDSFIKSQTGIKTIQNKITTPGSLDINERIHFKNGLSMQVSRSSATYGGSEGQFEISMYDKKGDCAPELLDDEDFSEYDTVAGYIDLDRIKYYVTKMENALNMDSILQPQESSPELSA